MSLYRRASALTARARTVWRDVGPKVRVVVHGWGHEVVVCGASRPVLAHSNDI